MFQLIFLEKGHKFLTRGPSLIRNTGGGNGYAHSLQRLQGLHVYAPNTETTQPTQ